MKISQVALSAVHEGGMDIKGTPQKFDRSWKSDLEGSSDESLSDGTDFTDTDLDDGESQDHEQETTINYYDDEACEENEEANIEELLADCILEGLTFDDDI